MNRRRNMKLKMMIIFSYIIPLCLPVAYSSAMLGLSCFLLMALIFYYCKRIIIYRKILAKTENDLSGFIKFHFSLSEREKYIVSSEEITMGLHSSKCEKILRNNQGYFRELSPEFADDFILYSGRYFVFKMWLALTIILAIFFSF